MKKIMWIFGVAVVWFLSILPVRADIIWEPQEPFYEEHAGECKYVNRYYTAVGVDGKVKVYFSPENAAVVDTIEKGKKIYISYVYTDSDGIRWGIVENHEDINKTGWVPMDYMEVVYDYISFKEEFGESFVEEEGIVPEEYAGETIMFWPYPGAPKAKEVVMSEDANNLPRYNDTFVDENGLKWGCVGYFQAIRYHWICLDNATGTLEELYPDGAPARGAVSAQTPDSDTDAHEDEESTEDSEGERDREEKDEAEIVPKGNDSLVLLVSGLVAAVVAVTGGLLFWLKKK